MIDVSISDNAVDDDDDDDYYYYSGGDDVDADDVRDVAAQAGKRPCKGFRPDLQSEQGGMLNFCEVYPWARHESGDKTVAGVTATSRGVIYSNACTGAVEEGGGSEDCCHVCNQLRYKPQLKEMLAGACLNYEGGKLYTNNRFLNLRQLWQRNETGRQIQQDLRLRNMNLAKKTVRVSRKLKTWKKIYLLLANQDVPGIR
jgi:hypothetical protein